MKLNMMDVAQNAGTRHYILAIVPTGARMDLLMTPKMNTLVGIVAELELKDGAHHAVQIYRE